MFLLDTSDFWFLIFSRLWIKSPPILNMIVYTDVDHKEEKWETDYFILFLI